MSQNYGTLERKVGINKKTQKEETAFMGMLAVPQVITGTCAVMKKDRVEGNEWPLAVRIKQDGVWATLGSAKWEQKNSQSNFYLRMVIESPVIDKIMGGPIWLRAFPQGAKNDGSGAGLKAGGAEFYDMVWGQGGGKSAANLGTELDDEIPFE